MVLLSFAAIPLLSRVKKLNIGIILIITALVMALLTRLSPLQTWDVFLDVFRKSSSLNTVLVVGVVGVMGTMMKEYGMLDKVVDALSSLVKNVRLLFILIPALVGTLTIPGGAILSAPFVHDLGEKVGMEKPKRAAANLIFRHVSVFLLPYSSSLLVVASMLPQYSVYQFIGVFLCFVIPMIIFGYILYLRKVPKRLEGQGNGKSTGQNHLQLLTYASPIYACIIVNMVTGLPLYACMLVSLLLIFLLGEKKGYLKLLISSIGWNTVMAVVGVFMIQGIVTQLPGLLQIFTNMFQVEALMLPALVLTSLFFGLITGFQIVPMGIVFPMLLSLSLGRGSLMAYTYIVYCCSFLGYYFSPLHMCQLFTCEFMGVKTNQLYRTYIPFVVSILLWLLLSYFALSLVLAMIMG